LGARWFFFCCFAFCFTSSSLSLESTRFTVSVPRGSGEAGGDSGDPGEEDLGGRFGGGVAGSDISLPGPELLALL
jgi:hypothetical protein